MITIVGASLGSVEGWQLTGSRQHTRCVFLRLDIAAWPWLWRMPAPKNDLIVSYLLHNLSAVSIRLLDFTCTFRPITRKRKFMNFIFQWVQHLVKLRQNEQNGKMCFVKEETTCAQYATFHSICSHAIRVSKGWFVVVVVVDSQMIFSI